MIQQRFVQINPLLSLVLFFAFLVIAYYVFVKLIVWLYYGTPILLLLAVLINHKHVFRYFGQLLLNIKRDPVSGTLSLIIRILALPFVSLWLMISGYFMRKMAAFESKMSAPKQEYTDYEIVE